MNFKAIIFDLDGTLIDSIPDITDAANKVMRNHKFPVHNKNSYIEWIGNGAMKLLKRAIPDNINEINLDDLLNEYLEIHSGNCTNKTSLYTGIDRILSYSNEQNISISILTNKPHEIAMKVYEKYLSKWKFECVQGQIQGYPKKPDAGRALKIAERLACKANEMLFIGDSDTDIKTGIAAGMIPIGVTWGYGIKNTIVEAGAKYLIKDTRELLEFLKSNNE